MSKTFVVGISVCMDTPKINRLDVLDFSVDDIPELK
jgi:hypothetical protein